MTAQEPDVAEETGEDAERIERSGGNLATTMLSGLDFIIIAMIIVVVASVLLTLFYGRQALSNIGIGLVGTGVNPVEAFFNGIAAAIQAAFARLARFINPGGYGYISQVVAMKVLNFIHAIAARIL